MSFEIEKENYNYNQNSSSKVIQRKNKLVCTSLIKDYYEKIRPDNLNFKTPSQYD